MVGHPSTMVNGENREKLRQQRASLIDRTPALEADERRALTDSWAVVKRMDLARCVFLRIFRQLPELRRVFGLSDDFDKPESPVFVHHLQIFLSVVDSLVTEVGNGHGRFREKLDPILLGLGAKHAKTANAAGFLRHNPECWDVFRDSLASAIVDLYYLARQRQDALELEEKRQLKRLWMEFLCYVSATIRLGFDRQTHDSKRRSFRHFLGRWSRSVGLLVFGIVILLVVIVAMVFVSRSASPATAVLTGVVDERPRLTSNRSKLLLGHLISTTTTTTTTTTSVASSSLPLSMSTT